MKVKIQPVEAGEMLMCRMGGSEFFPQRADERGVLVSTKYGKVFLAARAVEKINEVLRGDDGSIEVEEFVECARVRDGSTRSTGPVGRGSKKIASPKKQEGDESLAAGHRSTRGGTSKRRTT